ncbi:MAG TPA: DUF1302 family protein [Casimicrobiaceae bacterium]|nr:DUF1302 family protein [Casimicrobiaceae bacterium]
MSCALASTAALAQAPGDAQSDPTSMRTDDAPRVSIRIAPALFDRLIAADVPGSKSELFGDDTDQAPKGESRENLFGEEKPAGPTPAWHGFVRGELAYTYGEPEHWSKMLVRAELDGTGSLSENVKYKIGARLDYDFVYDATNFYPPDVRRDQRFNAFARENYLDIGAGDFDFRVGRQQVVWGEMVGLFFADVVSAKDLREFILPDFDVLRIPQWAGRAEYFKGDFHAEAVWIPVPSYDNIGKPGAEFFPAVPSPPPGFATLFDNEQFPRRTLGHTNFGLRLSYLKNGWDASGFYYDSMDAQPTFYRQVVLAPQPAFVYQARHDRIWQTGGTLAKDLGPAVFKAELVYTQGRSYDVLRLADEDGVVRQNTLDVIGGLDFALPADTRLDVQLFNRTFFDHDPDIVPKQNEPGGSLLVSHKFGDRLQAEVLYIASLRRTDYMIRPRLIYDVERNWQLIAGVDIFGGPPLGFFGQFSNRDRVYTEVRYAF